LKTITIIFLKRVGYLTIKDAVLEKLPDGHDAVFSFIALKLKGFLVNFLIKFKGGLFNV